MGRLALICPVEDGFDEYTSLVHVFCGAHVWLEACPEMVLHRRVEVRLAAATDGVVLDPISCWGVQEHRNDLAGWLVTAPPYTLSPVPTMT